MAHRAHERREEARREPPSPLRVEYPDIHPRVKDLSLNGAFIEDPRPLRPGRLVRLRLTDGANTHFEVRAMVRRVLPEKGMTVEFIEMSPDTQRRLRAFLGLTDARDQRLA